ncbi:thioredoxin family protein [Marivirga salinae]|uniref:Thioredoxin family protein n=1 Tax=Marivirga salinarum TaxID=3059078 RepID=A0AA49GBE8_9BACT|nr:thioredoxin family protein [Marivirga sp. BDSF4-3]WKK78352.2 thioredoxin family protein [Marivirga sp. BDSF4-3]
MSENKIISIKTDAFTKGIDYPSYRNMIKSLLSENMTTGSNHSEAMIAYTKMNDQRMSRWDKKINLADEIVNSVVSLPKMNWLVITEAWCGDAAQNIPFIAKLANENPNIDLRFIMRDEHPELMDQYLTNGARSIPILVIMDENFNDLATWGPRPDEVQNMVMEAKEKPDLDQSKFIESIHKWYSVDKNQTISQEFKQLIKNIK